MLVAMGYFYRFGIELKADLNYKTLGAKLKGDVKKVADAVKKLTDAQLMEFDAAKTMTICGHELTDEDVVVKYAIGAGLNTTGTAKYDALADREVGGGS